MIFIKIYKTFIHHINKPAYGAQAVKKKRTKYPLYNHTCT